MARFGSRGRLTLGKVLSQAPWVPYLSHQPVCFPLPHFLLVRGWFPLTCTMTMGGPGLENVPLPALLFGSSLFVSRLPFSLSRVLDVLLAFQASFSPGCLFGSSLACLGATWLPLVTVLELGKGILPAQRYQMDETRCDCWCSVGHVGMTPKEPIRLAVSSLRGLGSFRLIHYPSQAELA